MRERQTETERSVYSVCVRWARGVGTEGLDTPGRETQRGLKTTEHLGNFGKCELVGG